VALSMLESLIRRPRASDQIWASCSVSTSAGIVGVYYHSQPYLPLPACIAYPRSPLCCVAPSQGFKRLEACMATKPRVGAERPTLYQTEEGSFCAPPRSRGRTDVSVWKLSISCANAWLRSLRASLFFGSRWKRALSALIADMLQKLQV
jgi:hypothetical protein